MLQEMWPLNSQLRAYSWLNLFDINVNIEDIEDNNLYGMLF